jgi:uncharacterized membrane protein (Fun14 family)
MKSEDLIQELEKLREIVNQSSEHTQRQLQNIDSNLLIGSLLSFILALGISFQLKILIYWIPASFLLLYLWAFYELFRTRKAFTPENVEEIIQVFQRTDENILKFVFTWGLKMTAPIVTAVSLVYIITFIALLATYKTITVNQPFYILIPLISALLCAFLPLFLDSLTKFSEKGGFNDTFKTLATIKENVSPKRWRITLGCLKLGFIIIFVALALVLPAVSFLITYSIISDYIFLIIVLVLQLTFTIISSSYFSSLSVKKELTNTLTSFADIDYKINSLILSKDMKEEYYEKLKAQYLTAKQYDVSVDNSLKFVNLYTTSMNSVYLNKK